MKNEQLSFTELEARAVCEMLANLVQASYSIRIKPGPDYITFSVCIMDRDDAETASSTGHYLIDALANAYSTVPDNE